MDTRRQQEDTNGHILMKIKVDTKKISEEALSFFNS